MRIFIRVPQGIILPTVPTYRDYRDKEYAPERFSELLWGLSWTVVTPEARISSGENDYSLIVTISDSPDIFWQPLATAASSANDVPKLADYLVRYYESLRIDERQCLSLNYEFEERISKFIASARH